MRVTGKQVKPKQMTIKVAGVKYVVEFRHMDDYGITFLDKCRIYIKNDLKLEIQRETLIHEIFHVIVERKMKYTFENVGDISSVDKLEHLIIDPLACEIHTVLKGNKKLRGFLYGN